MSKSPSGDQEGQEGGVSPREASSAVVPRTPCLGRAADTESPLGGLSGRLGWGSWPVSSGLGSQVSLHVKLVTRIIDCPWPCPWSSPRGLATCRLWDFILSLTSGCFRNP